MSHKLSVSKQEISHSEAAQYNPDCIGFTICGNLQTQTNKYAEKNSRHNFFCIVGNLLRPIEI